MLFFFVFSTHTSCYSSGEVEAILAKAQATAKRNEWLLCQSILKKEWACGGVEVSLYSYLKSNKKYIS